MATVSVVSICNRTLDMLGADPIVSIDDASKRAKLLKRNFEPVRNSVLRAYPWNCAMKRAQLAALATAPLFDFGKQYTLPGDCLMLRAIADEDVADLVYKVEGRTLLTDEGAPLLIRYTAEITDPSLFDPLLADCIAQQLAADLAFPLVGNATLGQTMLQAYLLKLPVAKRADAREGSQSSRVDATTWVDSRA